jgi:hypothetical protein
MRTTQRVVASIVAASGLVALVGVILMSRLGPCGGEWDGQSRLSEVLFGFGTDFARGWALLLVALAAAVGSAIAALVIGASLDVRRGISVTAVLVAVVAAAAVVGLAIGNVLIRCEAIATEQTRVSLVPMGIAALVGAVPGYLVALGIATIAARRSGRVSLRRPEEESR